MEYQAALLNGKYKALSPKIRDEVPIGFQLTKDGNFLITTISVSRLHDKMMAWADKKPSNLTLWNGDTDAFWASTMKYLDNHAKGEKGEIGLNPDSYIAGKMKNRINDLFNAYNAETKESNPERSTLPRARGKDNLDTVIRGRRLDRINNFSESPSLKIPINYGHLTTNYMPAVNPMAAPMTAEEVQNRFDGSVTATRVRRAMATGEIDALESELRQMDDLLPTESLQLVQGEGEMPRIQIVSMFDPENVASLEPEEIVSDIDAETEAELAILDAQDGTVPPQDIAKVLSSKLDQLYADGGRSPIIPALESELEKIYQQLESQAEEREVTTEDFGEEPETTDVDVMNSPMDMIEQAVNLYNSGRVDEEPPQTLAEFVRGAVNSTGNLIISPDVTDEQIVAAADDVMQYRQSLKDRIRSGTQFSNATVAPAGLQYLPAFHGTPYDFEKFRMDKIGSGEGAQAFGYGLYFSGARAVGVGYRDKLTADVSVDGVASPDENELSDNEKIKDALSVLISALKQKKSGALQKEYNKIVSRSIATLENEQYGLDQSDPNYQSADKVINWWFNHGIKGLKDESKIKSGTLYKVDLDVNDEDLLDWFKPLSEHSEKVQNAVLPAINSQFEKITEARKSIIERGTRLGGKLFRPGELEKLQKPLPDPLSLTGEAAYKYVINSLGGDQNRDAPKASELLLSRGVFGIRYFDAMSRGAGEGTSNYVIFDENLIKILEKNDQLVGPVTQFMPATIEAPSGERGFQSKLQTEIQRNFKGARATPEQLKAVLGNPQNVKAEEVKWSGVMDEIDRLAQENNGKVPVQELLNYLRDEGQVKFDEVTLGENNNIKNVADQYRIRVEEEYGEAAFYDEFDDPLEFDELPIALQDEMYKSKNQPEPKFAKYQLRGGENYREVVMTMPSQKGVQILKDGKVVWEDNEITPTGKQISDLKYQYPESKGYSVVGKGSEQYFSSHFPDVPNYIAHMRVNERTDAQGNQGLFVEEFQSDRHQAGREKGYKEDVIPLSKEEENRKEEIKNKIFELEDQGIDENNPTPEYQALDEEFVNLAIRDQGGRISSVPDAPFRKDWGVQLFKRALRDAVESGKSWIGWTTGIEQVKRYEDAMRQAVDEIEWTTASGKPKAFGAIKNGKTVLSGRINDDGTVYDSSVSDANGQQLSEVVGKEIATKILAEKSGTATGNDLTVGGEGMKGFYDTILPKEIGKYVAKMGGKVEKSKIGFVQTFEDTTGMGQNKGYASAPIWRVNITPEMANVVSAGQLQFMPAEGDYPSVGININSKTQDFTDQILRGEKTIETRPSNSLKSLIGKRVGIVRTGKGKATLVGYANIEEPIVYNNVEEFRADQDKHLVEAGSDFDIKPDQKKYGYPLTDVESIEPIEVPSNLPNWYSARSIPQTQFMPAENTAALSDLPAPEAQQSVEKPLGMVSLPNVPVRPKKPTPVERTMQADAGDFSIVVGGKPGKYGFGYTTVADLTPELELSQDRKKYLLEALTPRNDELNKKRDALLEVGNLYWENIDIKAKKKQSDDDIQRSAEIEDLLNEFRENPDRDFTMADAIQIAEVDRLTRLINLTNRGMVPAPFKFPVDNREVPAPVKKPADINPDASKEDKAKYAKELVAYEAYVALVKKQEQDVSIGLKSLQGAVATLFKTKKFKEFITEAVGLSGIQFDNILGTWKFEPEPSFVFSAPNMTWDQAQSVTKWLSVLMTQDAGIAWKPSIGLTEGAQSIYLVHDKKLTDEQILNAFKKAKEVGIDGLSVTVDGKGIKAANFDNIKGFDEKLIAIQKVANIKNIHDTLVDSFYYDTTSDFTADDGSLKVPDWIKGESINENTQNQQGRTGEEAQDIGNNATTRGFPILLRRGLDSATIPYAKALAGEGFTFDPDLFAARYGLGQEVADYIREQLYPTTGLSRSVTPILDGTEKFTVPESYYTKGGRLKTSVNDLMYALQKRSADDGFIQPGDYSTRAGQIVAETIVDEIEGHIERASKNPKAPNAIGWYDTALKKMKKKYSEFFPFLNRGTPSYNADKEFTFDCVLGITSQGNNVFENGKMAARVQFLLEGGKTMPEIVELLYGTFGENTRAVENNLLKLNELTKNNKIQDLDKLFRKKMTVSEWNSYFKKNKNLYYKGEPLSVDGKSDQMVTGFSAFGPKIGSFINNLHGDYTTLTADLWFTRTWNRILGNVFQHAPLKEANQYDTFRKAILEQYRSDSAQSAGEKFEPLLKRTNKKGEKEFFDYMQEAELTGISRSNLDKLLSDPQKMLELATALEDRYRKGQYSAKSDLRRAAKNWVENRTDPVAAPRTDLERDFQQDVMEIAQKKLRRKKIDINIADSQAALWYNEKELFGLYGAQVSGSEPADYADSAFNVDEIMSYASLFKVNRLVEVNGKKRTEIVRILTPEQEVALTGVKSAKTPEEYVALLAARKKAEDDENAAEKKLETAELKVAKLARELVAATDEKAKEKLKASLEKAKMTLSNLTGGTKETSPDSTGENKE